MVLRQGGPKGTEKYADNLTPAPTPPEVNRRGLASSLCG